MPAAVDSADTGLKVADALHPVRLWTRWGPRMALLGCGVIGGDLVLHLGQGLSHAAFNLTLAGAAVLWLRGRAKAPSSGLAPTTISGWLQRCDALIEQLEQLPAAAQDPAQQQSGQAQRQQQLNTLRIALDAPELQLAIAGRALPPDPCQGPIAEALSTRQRLNLHWGEPLTGGADGWLWPPGLVSCDLLLYCLTLPLTAADLRWLEAKPAAQEAWVLAQLCAEQQNEELQRRELAQQLQQIPQQRLLLWGGEATQLSGCLEPLRQTLQRDGLTLRQAARLQQVQGLHQQWLVELEQRRRQQLQLLVQKTQWLVAAGVLASPVTSLDLVVLTAANGLMLKEVAKLWNCSWSLEQLQAAAAELAEAALTLGVIEWSNQALANLLRLHGASWLVGGALQALSAAYLTRVVARAMADTLALAAGLSAPNLALIKAQAPQLVLQAAEAEKINWTSFLEQGRQWLAKQQLPPASQAATAGA